MPRGSCASIWVHYEREKGPYGLIQTHTTPLGSILGGVEPLSPFAPMDTQGCSPGEQWVPPLRPHMTGTWRVLLQPHLQRVSRSQHWEGAVSAAAAGVWR